MPWNKIILIVKIFSGEKVTDAVAKDGELSLNVEHVIFSIITCTILEVKSGRLVLNLKFILI